MTTETTTNATYVIQFAGDYFALQTTVVLDIATGEDASSEEAHDKAVSEGIALISNHYGWDIESVANEISVEMVYEG